MELRKNRDSGAVKKAEEHMRKTLLLPITSFAIKNELSKFGLAIPDLVKAVMEAGDKNEVAGLVEKTRPGTEVPENVSAAMGKLISARRNGTIVLNDDGGRANIFIAPESEWLDAREGANFLAEMAIGVQFEKEEPLAEKPAKAAKIDCLDRLTMLAQDERPEYSKVVARIMWKFHPKAQEIAAEWCLKKIEEGMPPEQIERVLEDAHGRAPKLMKGN